MMAGGLSGTRAADGNIQAIADAVKESVQGQINRTFDVFQATHYTSQVVAGTNYFLKVKISDGASAEFIHLRVFQALPHTGQGPAVHSVQENKTEACLLSYF